MAYHSKRKILSVLPCRGKTGYHLFSIDPGNPKTDEIVKLCQKSKWSSQYDTSDSNFIASVSVDLNVYYFKLDNCISSFDFDPQGDSIATIDRYSICLISNVNTHNYGFHLKLGDYGTISFISDACSLCSFN